MSLRDPVLETKDLKTFFYTREGVVKAVNGVNLHLERSQVLGVVGESGCGKSVTSLAILRLVPRPGKIISGEILFNGTDLLKLSIPEMRNIRGERISMIFQEPMISLNPAFTIGNQLMEAVRVHRKVGRAEARDRAIEYLTMVGIPAPERRIREYPYQLSGGMRQRVMIAESLLLNPDILIADEPTTALDVTIQAQILDILHGLTQKSKTAIMLITHNLGLVAEWAQQVVVIYAGKIVEQGPVKAIFENASHPYTHGLLRSIPIPGQRRGEKLHEIRGIVPSLVDLPRGCAFHPRCSSCQPVCTKKEPPWHTVETGHRVACWLFT